MYNADDNLKFRKDESFGDFLQVLREDKKTNGKAILEEDEVSKPDETPQNLKTKEEPEVDPEDLGLEDHEKDDFNKAGAKVKSDSDANKELAIKEVPEDKKQRINGSKNESKDLDFDKNYLNWQRHVKNEFVQENPDYSEYDPEKIEITEEGEVFVHEGGAYPAIFKGFTSWDVWQKKNESTEPLWLCNNCDKTFRNSVNECTFCLSNMTERITPISEGDDVPFDEDGKFAGLTKGQVGDLQGYIEDLTDNYEGVEVYNIERRDGIYRVDFEYWSERRQKESHDTIYCTFRPDGPADGRLVDFEVNESTNECGDRDMADEIISVYQKHRSAGRSREEAVQAAVKSTGREVTASAVRNLLMKKGIREQEEDKYNPEKNLKSELTDLFYTKEFALVDEQKSATGVHLEYKRGDELVKVFIED